MVGINVHVPDKAPFGLVIGAASQAVCVQHLVNIPLDEIKSITVVVFNTPNVKRFTTREAIESFLKRYGRMALVRKTKGGYESTSPVRPYFTSLQVYGQ